MQSVPVGPALSGVEPPWWKNIGYYLWLLAIGAIVYAYVFATSADASSYRGINTKQDPVTGAPMNNVGNQVSLLLGAILAYMGLVKLWSNGSNGQTQLPYAVKIGLNAFITFGLLIGLVFVSFRSTQYGINPTQSTAQDSLGFFGSNIGLMGIIPIALVVIAFRNGWAWMDAVNDTFQTAAQFVMNFWFPLVMMYYFIRLGSNYWFQIVAGVSLSVSILLLCYNWRTRDPTTTTTFAETGKQILKDLWNSFPFAPYLKYVANTDLMEVAKRVVLVAFMCYVAYLMISVYKFKHELVPCAGTGVASCFGWWSEGGNDTPYVNALFWTLVASVGVNVVNWIVQMSCNLANSNGTSTTTTPTPSANMTTAEKIIQLIKLVGFPVYWTVSVFMNNPVAAGFALMAFAALGVLLYRSSFDLTDFVEGQRGTVMTLFAMFIASLAVFGAYIYMKSPTADIAQDTMTYGTFIGKTGMVVAIAVCIVGLLLYFLNSHSKLATVAGIAQFGITALIYITGIAIVIILARDMVSHKMGGSMFQMNPESNWVINVLKLFGNLLFYLPCLMLDFAVMLKEQYGLTTQPALILLALEAAFILAGHLLPSAVAKAINHTGVQILSAPISMNAPITITTYNLQFVDAYGVEEIPTPTASPTGGASPTTVLLRNYNYGVSAWFYIHPQPPTTNPNYDSDKDYINLLQLGSPGPSMQYNPRTNAMQFGLYGTPIELTAKDIPLQTWNNVIINSDKGAVDIFINGKLIYTGHHVPKTNDPVPNAVHNVTVGQADGVHGEVCNVVLNTAPFTKPEIAWLYKINKALNPPVVGANMDPLNQGDAASVLATDAVNAGTPTPTPMPTYSTYGARTYGILGVVLGAIFGWMFNHESHMETVKGGLMGAVVFGLIGASLGALFSTDGTVAYVLKTVANVFVDTF